MGDLIDEGVGGGSAPIPEARVKDDVVSPSIPEARVKDDVVSPSSPTDAIRDLMREPGFAFLVFAYGIAVAVRAFFNLNPATGDWLVERYEHNVADRADRNFGGRDM